MKKQYKIVILLLLAGVVFLLAHLEIIPFQAGQSVVVCLTNSQTGNPICGGRICVENDFSGYYLCQNTKADGCTPSFSGDFSQGRTRITIVGGYRGLTNPQQSYSEYLVYGSYTKRYSISSSTDRSSECNSGTPTTIRETCSDSDGGKNIYVRGCVSGIAKDSMQSIYACDSCTSDAWWWLKFGEGEYVKEYYCENGYVRGESIPCPGKTCYNGVCSGVITTTTTTTSLRTTTTTRAFTTTIRPTTYIATSYYPTTTYTTYYPTTTLGYPTTTYITPECYSDSDCLEGKICVSGKCVLSEKCEIYGIPCDVFNIGTLVALILCLFYIRRRIKKK